MILEGVRYLSINALYERVVRMEKNFGSANVPHSVRRRILGIDGAEFDSVDMLIDAGPAWLAPCRDSWMGRGSVAYQWGIQRLYAAIADLPYDDQCVLVLLDDAYLTRPWHEYVRLAAELPDFDIVQLYQWDPLETPERAHYLRVRADFAPLEPCSERSDFTIGTHYPGEHATLVSVRGARWCCEQLERNPIQFLEWGIPMHGRPGRVLSPTVPLTDSWILVASEESYRADIEAEEG